MPRAIVSIVCLSLMLALSGSPVLGHHSIQTQFDVTKSVTLKGLIAAVEWRQPHVLVRVRVPTVRSGSVDWVVQTLTPQALGRLGVVQGTLKPGDVVILDVFASNDGRYNAVTQSITLSDGRTVPTKVSAGGMNQ
jgi:hypothetical protein